MNEAVLIDTELSPGARNAIRVCLNVQPHERVTVITDRVTSDIAASLARELQDLGASHPVWMLEDVASRPLTGLPDPIARDLERSHVSIFAARAQPNELAARMQMTEVVNRRRIRPAPLGKRPRHTRVE